MCGIIGYTGERICKPLLIEGLERLEYRGYDSSGISLVEDDGLAVVRSVGNLAQLKAAAEQWDSSATTGIGHTRWATHGRPSEENAHPFTGCHGRFSVVLNGIVENYLTLKAQLVADGHAFSSETDAEVVAHLIETFYEGDLVLAVQRTFRELQGHFAFVVASPMHPDTIVGARLQCPLVAGLGEGETFLASDVVAFLRQTRIVKVIEDGELVVVTPSGAELLTMDLVPVDRDAQTVAWDDDAAEKAGYETFMLKEIHEQPKALQAMLAERFGADGRIELDAGFSDEELATVERVVITGCGTAYHAGLVGRYLLERWARLPVETEVASEFRYRDPILDGRTLVVSVSQSGESADTIAAQRVARDAGARTLAVCNVLGTQIVRESEGTLFTRAGRETSVAATKTFTSQALAFVLLALKLAQVRGTLPAGEIASLRRQIERLPLQCERLLTAASPVWAQTDAVADAIFEEQFMLYMGRHLGVPVALEGALKLKEISYIPTDSYAAGEMKHGPIALLATGTPVVAVMTDSHVFDKVVSNVQEVRARGARVVAIASEGGSNVSAHADFVIEVPRVAPELAPILASLPLQVLAYGIARRRGLPIDQPRNLAKTVTVE